MRYPRQIRKMLLALALCLFFVGTAAAETQAHLPTGIPADELAEYSFALPEGHEILDTAWIGGTKEQVLLLLGSPMEDAVKLAVADLVADGSYRLAAVSGTLLPYKGFEPQSGIMMDKWDNRRPYYWWGAGGPPTEREIYLSLAMNEEGAWYVAFGHIADADGTLLYAFWQEEPGSLTVHGETLFPQIRWRTEVSLLLEGFDLAAAEDVCRDAMAFTEVIQRESECLEYRIEEPGGNG